MTISQLQFQTANAGSVSSLSVTLPSATSSGSCIVADLDYFQGGSASLFSSIADNASNTYTSAFAEFGPNNGQFSAIRTLEFYKPNANTNAALQVTCTLTGSSAAVTVSVREVAGLDHTTPLDQVNTLFDAALTTSKSISTSSPTTVANEFVIAKVGENTTATTVTSAGAGYTSDLNNASYDSSHKIISVTGVQTGSWTYGTNVYVNMSITTWKAAAGGVTLHPTTLALMGVG